jgi:hypothetical protein
MEIDDICAEREVQELDNVQLATLEAVNNDLLPTGDWSGKPAIPASTVTATNDSGHLMAVYVIGGTVTVIAVEGVTTGLTAGLVLLKPGATIAITYSVVPTAWRWIALK